MHSELLSVLIVVFELAAGYGIARQERVDYFLWGYPKPRAFTAESFVGILARGRAPVLSSIAESLRLMIELSDVKFRVRPRAWPDFVNALDYS